MSSTQSEAGKDPEQPKQADPADQLSRRGANQWGSKPTIARTKRELEAELSLARSVLANSSVPHDAFTFGIAAGVEAALSWVRGEARPASKWLQELMAKRCQPGTPERAAPQEPPSERDGGQP